MCHVLLPRRSPSNNALLSLEVQQWHQRRDRRMLAVQRAKFTMYPELSAALLATYPAKLLAHAYDRPLARLMQQPHGTSHW